MCVQCVCINISGVRYNDTTRPRKQTTNPLWTRVGVVFKGNERLAGANVCRQNVMHKAGGGGKGKIQTPWGGIKWPTKWHAAVNVHTRKQPNTATTGQVMGIRQSGGM